jgi:hypothetical protein
MAYIMNQVNGPQYTVWANRKFVGKDTRAVSDYILEDRDTINEQHDEMLDVHQEEDFEGKEHILLEVDDTIFDYPERSSFTSRIDLIAEIDPIGSCFLRILSKKRPTSFRESISIA